MKTSKIKFVYLLLISAVTFNLTSCDNDDDDDDDNEDVKTITFENINLGESKYWKGDTTGAIVGKSWGTPLHGSSVISGDATFYNKYATTVWYGFAFSANADTSVAGDYTNEQYLYMPSLTSGTYAIAYGDSAEFEFNEAKTIKSLQICNTTYTYKVIRDGNSYSKIFADEDYFTVTFTGFDADGKTTGSKVAYLADFTNGKSEIVDSWKTVDLSTLGKVKSVIVTFQSTDMSSYGYLNTPEYVAIDNIKYAE